MKLTEIEKKKKTLATTYRGDIRTVATLALFWSLRGEHLQSLNSVLRVSLEGLKEMVVDKHPDLEFPTVTADAEYLANVGLLDFSKKFQNKVTLLKELSLESITNGGVDPSALAVSITREYHKDLGPYRSVQEKEKLEAELVKRTVPTVVPPDLKMKNDNLENIKDRLSKPPQEEDNNAV